MLPVGYLPCTQEPPNGNNIGRLIEEIFGEAAAAEASGWDGCFITEHHQQADGYLPSPLLMAAMIGALFQMRRQHLCDPFHEGADAARQIAPMRHDESHGERPATKVGHDLDQRSTFQVSANP